MLRLHVVPPAGASFDFEAADDSVIVGRALDCDLVLADAFLSRQHARLYRRAGTWYVEDLGSRNGTRLNGEPLRETRPLAAGDAVALCGSVLEVRPSAAPGEGKDPPGPPQAATPPRLPAAAPQPVAGASPGGDATYFLSARELLQAHRSPNTADGGPEMDLRRWADRLRLVNEVHRELGRSLAEADVLEGTLDRVFDHLRPERGAVYLRRPGDGGFRLAARRPDEPEESFLHSRSLLREVVDKGLGALVLDVRTDERFSAAHSMLDFGVRSLVAAPLFDGETSLGMIALDSRYGVRQFQREDLELLVSIASAAALRLRNLELAEEATERRRLADELALARRIQVALLPQRLPLAEGWQLYGGNLPSRGVSGDFYEVVERGGGDDRELFAVLADVSGKGMAASLVTASLEALLAPLIEEGLPCDRVAARVSRLLAARTPPERFATAVLAVLEPIRGREAAATVRYTSAGHNPGLVLRGDGSAEELGATGPPLGLVDDAEYGCGTLRLAPGDLLVLYTDGLVEAMDPDGAEYGLPRLAAACRRHRDLPLADLARALDADVGAFVRGVPFDDDRTLLLVRRQASS